MPDIVFWEQDGVINAMSLYGYESRDRQEQLVDKYWRAGHTNEEARNLARQEIADPAIITFAIDTNESLTSPTGAYGHGGYSDLFAKLVEASGYTTVKRVMKIRNANNDWSVPPPQEADIAAIFGLDAIPVYWHYRQTRGLGN